MLIHCRIVRRAISWCHIIGTLLLLRESVISKLWIRMVDCFRTTSLFTDCQVTRTKRHVPLLTMTSPTWCCLRRRKRLINVSSSRPKPEGPYPSQLAATDELKKKQDKVHLQWPPLKDNSKVIHRTLGLYQHGPQPKSGTSNQWPPPVQNPWDKEFIPKDFTTTHKIPSTMPKRWDLHVSSPLMLRPPQSTAVTEVPDSEISKCPSWLEAFAARTPHTASMSATSMVGVYNFLQKIIQFLRASTAKDNIKNDITLVDDLIQRANSML